MYIDLLDHNNKMFILHNVNADRFVWRPIEEICAQVHGIQYSSTVSIAYVKRQVMIYSSVTTGTLTGVGLILISSRSTIFVFHHLLQ